MGDFAPALMGTYGVEGIYSLDPDDPGGETVFGVARKKWPNLALWKTVDLITGASLSEKVKANKNTVRQLIANSSKLQEQLKEFYKQEFWDKLHLDEFPQILCNEIFEQAVNIGVVQCIKHIQRTLNILNRNETAWDDIEEDGLFGNGTLRALKAGIEKDLNYVVKILNMYQGAFYLELKNEKYIRGWSTRV